MMEIWWWGCIFRICIPRITKANRSWMTPCILLGKVAKLECLFDSEEVEVLYMIVRGRPLGLDNLNFLSLK